MTKQIAYNIDCMEYMKTLPDKAFDLAIVDPPYGDADGIYNPDADKRGRYHRARTGGTWAKKYGKAMTKWDVAPPPEYFEQLFRVSVNQIIWGGNYFDLPPTRCFVVWHKFIPENFTMAMCEYAWTSFNSNAKWIQLSPKGTAADQRFHPTQKPVALYEWLLRNYAKPGDKILDTHLGSGSSRIAAYNLGFDFVGCEIDKDYFNAQEERFKRHTAQIRLFDIVPEPTEEQMKLI